MHRIINGEDARERQRRFVREDEARQEVIRQRDADAPSEALTFALRQLDNLTRNIPLDYAGIIKYRALEPGNFTLLPADDECRRQLGIGAVRKGKGF